MTVSILGEKISLVRPEKVYKCRVYKDEHPEGKYNKRSKRIKENSGRVKAVCIKLINGEIFSLLKGTHMDVCAKHDISTHYVKKVGWLLENGNYVWR